MKRICAALLMVALMAGAAWAEEVKLFKDYYYGMSKADVQKISKAKPCEEYSLKGNLCSQKKVPFIDYKWEQAFAIERKKLVSVLLARPFNNSAYMSAVSATINNGFMLVAISSETDALDVVQVIHKNGADSLSKEAEQFEKKALATGEITYSFFETDKIVQYIKEKKVKNLGELIAVMPKNIRSVDVKVRGNTLAIQFLAPIIAQQDMEKAAKEAKEDF